jgi:phytoene dehydrogenase-like protein
VYALDALPGFAATTPTARFIMVERLEACIAAHAAARAGRLPDELALEVVVPTAFDSTLAPQGRHLLSARIRPLPVAPQQGWQALAGALAEKVLVLFERAAPGFGRSVLTHAFVPPRADGDAPDMRRALASWRERCATPIGGLYLCGKTAEPIPALSGRAARIAAGMALAQLKGASA